MTIKPSDMKKRKTEAEQIARMLEEAIDLKLSEMFYDSTVAVCLDCKVTTEVADILHSRYSDAGWSSVMFDSDQGGYTTMRLSHMNGFNSVLGD